VMFYEQLDEELPSPEELMPLSQSLITPDLALAFNIPIPHHTPPPHSTAISSQPNSSAEFDSPEMSGTTGGGGGGGDEPARALKPPRLLHKRFVDAVAHLGIKNAVLKTVMQLMSVDGLPRENKYRLYLKRMLGISRNGGGNNNPTALSASGMDAATNHLFASLPVPAHFLHTGRPNPTITCLSSLFPPPPQCNTTTRWPW
ncbi:hypothetical protein MIMGU_mgv11b022949mg, partial [Erythranthe guttata]